ncbi:MAG: hypothetical protein Q8L26_02585 [Candidatus Omnitrophota bacterium]|nr:hypothetical protein [Candidatus Omnitrophota bacterium]
MLRPALDTSVSLVLPKLIFKYVKFIYKGIVSLYKNSLIRRLSGRFSEKIITYFTYSIFGSITQRKNTEYLVLYNSRLALFFMNCGKRYKNGLLGYSSISKTVRQIKSIKADFILSPLRIIGIMIISAVAANIFLNILFNNDVSLLGWMTRCMFIVVGIIGASCKTDLQALKNGSFIVKKIFSPICAEFAEK